MPSAIIGSVKCTVQVDKDLGDTWAVTIHPPAGPKGPSAPLVVKLQGNDKALATKGALEILQKTGKIDRYEL